METNQEKLLVPKKPRAILPDKGIWTVGDLANWLGIKGILVQQILSDKGIKVISFSSRYKHKIFRMEDLKANGKTHDD